jgi:gamma-glutamyltranspeptidase/glutathione hydrolase
MARVLHTVSGQGGIVTAPHHWRRRPGSGAEGRRQRGPGDDAVAATLAVVYPHMTGIGGDGFWLIREADGRVHPSMAWAARRRRRLGPL